MFIDWPSDSGDIIGSPEEREKIIGDLISRLSVATIGELTWVERNLKNMFEKRYSDENGESSDVFAQAKEKVNHVLKKYDLLIKELANTQEEKTEVESRISTLQTEYNVVITEKNIVESEKNLLSEELHRISSIYENITGNKIDQEDLHKLLSIYINLIDDIFSGRTHFIILSMMFGEKKHWLRKELAISTGISELNIRKALGELRDGNLIEYDDETMECWIPE